MNKLDIIIAELDPDQHPCFLCKKYFDIEETKLVHVSLKNGGGGMVATCPKCIDDMISTSKEIL